MQTVDEEISSTCPYHLEIFTCHVFVDDKDLSHALLFLAFFESDGQEVALVEGHFWREVFFDCADQVEFIRGRVSHQIGVSHYEMLTEYILALEFQTFQLDVDHILKLVSLKVPEDIWAIFETGKQIFSNLREISADNWRSCSTFVGSAVIDPRHKLFPILIRRQNISSEDISIGADEENLTACCFLEDGPLPDDGVGLLCSDGQYLPAGVVEHSDFLVNSDENTHFGQFYLVDIEIADIVPIAASGYMSIVVDVQQGDVVKPSCAEQIFIDWWEIKGMYFEGQGMSWDAVVTWSRFHFCEAVQHFLLGEDEDLCAGGQKKKFVILGDVLLDEGAGHIVDGVLFADIEGESAVGMDFEHKRGWQFEYGRWNCQTEFPVLQIRQGFGFINFFIAEINHEIDEFR